MRSGMLLYNHRKGINPKGKEGLRMNYHGYKVTCGKTSTYRSLYGDAKTTAWNLMTANKQDAIVWGLTDRGAVRVHVARKNPPRT